ncbi:MAG: hypothetical protein ACREX8_14395, partial [Gammaproteobacteria bacterium]
MMDERSRLEGELADLELSFGAPPAEREMDFERTARLNRGLAATLGWQSSRDRILALLNLSAGADERRFAEAVGAWQAAMRPPLPQDGILGARSWAVMATILDLSSLPAAVRSDIVERIGQIAAELVLPLATADAAGLAARRRRLNLAFESMPAGYAMRLYARLHASRRSDGLAALFYEKLATATRR